MCADVFTQEQRSKVMAKIKGKNTKPEITVRSVCHALGLRFRLHRKDLPGRPDLVFPKRRLCLFVHGCFWHQHPGCKYAYQPKTRPEFWLPKLQKNVVRDHNAKAELEALGWKVAIIWECQTKKKDLLEADIRALLEDCSQAAF
jgi:DNA mismatch endonuclease (patch repair protein)